MKITANQYARTLFELVDGKSSDEVDEIVSNFIKKIKEDKQFKILPRIIEKFSSIWNEQYKIAEAQITSSKKLDEAMIKKVENYIKKKYKAEKVVISNKIDKNIIEGLIIRVGDDLLDASAVGQLKKLSRILTK